MGNNENDIYENLIDANHAELERVVRSSEQLVEMSQNPLPVLKDSSRYKINEKDRGALEVREVIRKARVAFEPAGEFPLEVGLVSIDAMLGNNDFVDNNREVRLVAFLRHYEHMADVYKGDGVTENLVSLIGRIRAVAIARETLTENPQTFFASDADVLEELEKDNDRYLREAYADLAANDFEKFRRVHDFIISSASTLDRVSNIVAHSTTKSTYEDFIDGTKDEQIPKKDALLEEDIRDLDVCLENSNKVLLLMLSGSTLEDETLNLLELPPKEATGVELSRAYYELKNILDSNLGAKGTTPKYSFDVGLRALGSKLGDTQYHGPRYDNQFVTFMLRMNNIIESDIPNKKDRIKNVITYMRAAQLARTGSVFESATEIVAKVGNDSKYLLQAQAELSAYNSIVFEDLYEVLKETCATMGKGVQRIEENPKWITF